MVEVKNQGLITQNRKKVSFSDLEKLPADKLLGVAIKGATSFSSPENYGTISYSTFEVAV